MYRSRFLLALFVVAQCASVFSCTTTPGGSDVTAAGNGTVPAGFLGKWENRFSVPTETEIRTFEFRGDGTYVECYGEIRYDSLGAKLAEGTKCTQGVWSDMGSVKSIHGDMSRSVKGWLDRVPLIENARMLKFDRADVNTSTSGHFMNGDGLVMTRVGDSLIYLGHFAIASGGTGRLDSTFWRTPGGDMDSLFLAADSIATARVSGVSGLPGKWSIDSTGRMTAVFNQPSSSTVIQGIPALQGSNLILTNLADPANFAWVGPAGQ